MMVFRRIISIYDKDRNMYGNIIGTALIKTLSLVLIIVSLTAYTLFFNADNTILGVWLTITSILSWVVSFDLGIGNGLRNNLVQHISTGDIKRQKICISSAYILISTVSLIILLSFSAIVGVLNWNTILKVSPSVITNNALIKTVRIAFFGLIMQFNLKLVVSILYALKKTAIGSISPLISHILIVAYAFSFRSQSAEKGLINISSVYAAAVVLPLLVTTIVIFRGKMKNARPSLRHYNHKTAKTITSLGSKFFGIQILLMIINSTNSIIVAQISGPEAVVCFSMYFRLFSAGVALFSVIANPIWSSISESYVNRDYSMIISRKRVINKLALLFSVGFLSLVPILQFFIDLFYGKGKMIVNFWYALAFALLSCAMIFVTSISCIENGTNFLRSQIVGNTVAAALKIPLIAIFVLYISRDWIWVVVTNIVIMIVSYLIQHVGFKRFLSSLKVTFSLSNGALN